MNKLAEEESPKRIASPEVVLSTAMEQMKILIEE